jgi:hypothetical protein
MQNKCFLSCINELFSQVLINAVTGCFGVLVPQTSSVPSIAENRNGAVKGGSLPKR